MNDFIDKDSPDNLSDRDKPIYEEWLSRGKFIPQPWYNNIYCKTDHFDVIREVVSASWKYKCSICDSREELLAPHHKHYESLWREEFSDMQYPCKDCHERFHDKWPEVNCKGSRYAGGIIVSVARRNLNKRCEKNNVSPKPAIKAIEGLLRDLRFSKDKKTRESAYILVNKMILCELDEKFQYSALTKKQLVFFLIEAFYSWKTGDMMPDMRTFENISPSIDKVNFIEKCSPDATYLLGRLSAINVYKDIDNLCSAFVPIDFKM